MMSSRYWNKHYDIEMTFDALHKELYSLKQGSGKNIAEFGVHLSQQLQILQSSIQEGSVKVQTGWLGY